MEKSQPIPAVPLASTVQLAARLVRERWRPYAGQYLLAAILMLVVAGTTAAVAWLMKDVINQIFVAQDQTAVIWIPATIIGIFVAKGLASYFQEVILTRVGNRLVADTQKQLFDHLLKMDVRFYQDHPSSELITRITYSAAAARDMIATLFTGLGRDLLTLIGLVIVMVWQDPMMCLISLTVGPIAFFFLRRMTAKVKRAAATEMSSLSQIASVVRETAQGIRIVKSFQLEPRLSEQMNEAVDRVMAISNRIIGTKARVNPLIETLGGIAIALVVLYAGWRNLSDPAAPGQFFSFVTALLLASDPARRLSRVQLQLANASIGVKQMFELLDRPANDAHGGTTTPFTISRGAVTFEHVSFAYTPGTPVLRDLMLTAEAGKTTALVGSSGGGKTTILSLLQRFWSPDQGRILIDGQDIARAPLPVLRRQITYVSQDVFLFEGTIGENIRAANPMATLEQVREATRAAHALDFVESLPRGFDTRVGELGSNLSGGQRQRISMARAFLKNAPIILLDEPTSALDSESEQIIQAAIKELTAGKTTIVIAHRLSTILAADMIHVLDQGAIAESGTHAALLARQGFYAKLSALQRGSD